jgi:hypothetical protein
MESDLRNSFDGKEVGSEDSVEGLLFIVMSDSRPQAASKYVLSCKAL